MRSTALAKVLSNAATQLLIKQGEWIVEMEEAAFAASTDGEDANRYEAWLTPYCHNCGAKMDKEENL